IVAVFSMIIGFIFMTEVSLSDLIKILSVKLSSMKEALKTRLKMYQQTTETPIEEDVAPPVSLNQDTLKEEPVIQDFSDISYAYDEDTAENNMQTKNEQLEQSITTRKNIKEKKKYKRKMNNNNKAHHKRKKPNIMTINYPRLIY